MSLPAQAISLRRLVLNKTRVLLTATCMLAAMVSVSFAGDLGLAKKIADKADVIEGARQGLLWQAKKSGNPKVHELAQAVDYTAVRDAYAKAFADNMTDEELRAMLQLYNIPKIQDVMRKLPVVLGHAQSAITVEIGNAAKKIGGFEK